MTSRSATIQEVAALAGVSVASVSRTIQFPERVSKKTKAKVQDAIDRLSYVPNAQARNLRTSQSKLIVALISDIANPFVATVVRGIEAVAKEHGYTLLLGDTQHEIELEQRYADMVSARLADGLITFMPRVPIVRKVAGGRAPVVTVCETVDDETISNVIIDNIAAMRNAATYLLDLGHKSFAFIGGPADNIPTRERLAGLREALAAAGLEQDPRLCAHAEYSMDGGARAADSIFSYELPFTALVCASDELAIGAMHAARQRGLTVPGDVSVIGFDDISYARYCDPPLTTVAIAREEIGREAMLMLLRILVTPELPAQRRILPTQLIVRGTTAPPSRR